MKTKKAIEPVKAKFTVYRNYIWRKGLGRRYELYKSTSEKEIKNTGRSESSELLFKVGDVISSHYAKNSLEYRAAIHGYFTY
jgi:predicted transcriptional regulator